MDIRLQPIQPRDWRMLQKIAIRTFRLSYEDKNDPVHFQEYLDKAFSAATLKAELENPLILYYFVLLKGAMIGYIKLNIEEAQTEDMGPGGIQLERIYLEEQQQGKGLGRWLIQQCKAIARKMDKEVLWLGVWEKNDGAIQFYKRQGFEENGRIIFNMGNEPQEDYIMMLKV